jgi:putative membrane protein
MAMRTSLRAVLLSASLLAAPAAFAQTTIIPMPPAPAPTATGPAMATGIPATPLTASDTKFVRGQLEGNMAEVQIAQLALKQSQDQNIRNFAQKMITDHTAANGTLMPIAQAHGIAMPATLDSRHERAMERLSKLNGAAFDTAYINDMIRMHDATVKAMNEQLASGQSPVVNVWVQNTRPTVMQHEMVAQQIKAELPRTG